MVTENDLIDRQNLVTDAANLFMEEHSIDITIYKHKGEEFIDEDNIWHTDSGYETNTITIPARVSSWGRDEEMEEMGFSDKAEISFWVLKDKIDNGDKLEFEGQEWIVTDVLERKVEGKPYRWEIGARSADS